ncbi:MAG: hypothetical protein ACK550_17345 [Synechococcaceae cyanobacterium]
MPNPHPAAVDLSSLLDGSSSGELIPEMVCHGLQQLIQLELAAFLGADWRVDASDRGPDAPRSGSATATATGPAR